MTRRRLRKQPFSLFAFQDIITSVTGVMILVTLILALELMTRVAAAPPAQTVQQLETSQRTIPEIQSEIIELDRQLKAANSELAGLPTTDPNELREMELQLDEDARRLQEELNQVNQQRSEKDRLAAAARETESKQRAAGEQRLAEIERRIKDAHQKLQEIVTDDRTFFTSGVVGKTVWVVEITQEGFLAAKIGVRQPPRRFRSPNDFDHWVATLNARSVAFYLVVKPGGEWNFRSAEDIVVKHGCDRGREVVADNTTILDPQNGAGT